MQHLSLLMWFTNTKESVPTMDNPHDVIILPKPLLLVNYKKEGFIFLYDEIQASKNISQDHLLGNLH